MHKELPMDENKKQSTETEVPNPSFIAFTIDETGNVNFFLQNIDMDKAYLAAVKGLVKFERAFKSTI
jgi:hypothetical protein